jgi:hypothetical protein
MHFRRDARRETFVPRKRSCVFYKLRDNFLFTSCLDVNQFSIITELLGTPPDDVIESIASENVRLSSDKIYECLFPRRPSDSYKAYQSASASLSARNSVPTILMVCHLYFRIVPVLTTSSAQPSISLRRCSFSIPENG